MKFYSFRMPDRYGYTFARCFGEEKYGPRCQVCGRPKGGPIPPVAIRFEKDVRIADFVWAVTEILAVDQVKHAFEAEDVKGIEYLDVRVRIVGTQEKLRSKLWHLSLHRAAHAAPAMRIVPRSQCPGCGIVDYSTWDDGVVIDETTWDGSDMFRLHEDVVGIIVTEKIRRIVEQKGFTGVSLVPAEEAHDRWPDSRPRPI